MATGPPEPAASGASGSGADRLARFDAAERALHWANAVLFGVLIVTAAILVGPLSALVGRRALIRQVHVVAGLGLPVPLLLALAVPRRRARLLRGGLRSLGRFDAGDWVWLRSFGRRRGRGFGKFHPGQKPNASFTAGSGLVLLGTGTMLRWFEPFPVEWRSGATFVQDWTGLAVLVAVFGHAWLALSEPDSLRAMVRGWIPAAWAARHRPRWIDDPAPAPSSHVSAEEVPARAE